MTTLLCINCGYLSERHYRSAANPPGALIEYYEATLPVRQAIGKISSADVHQVTQVDSPGIFFSGFASEDKAILRPPLDLVCFRLQLRLLTIRGLTLIDNQWALEISPDPSENRIIDVKDCGYFFRHVSDHTPQEHFEIEREEEKYTETSKRSRLPLYVSGTALAISILSFLWTVAWALYTDRFPSSLRTTVSPTATATSTVPATSTFTPLPVRVTPSPTR